MSQNLLASKAQVSTYFANKDASDFDLIESFLVLDSTTGRYMMDPNFTVDNQDPEWLEQTFHPHSVLLMQGHEEDAFMLAQIDVIDHPDSSEAHSRLGFSYLLQGDYDLALEHNQKSIDLMSENSPGNPPGDNDIMLVGAYNQRASFLQEAGRYTEARECLDKAIEMEPEWVALYGHKADILMQEGHIEEAMETYKQALVMDSSQDYSDFQKQMIAKQMGCGSVEEALQLIEDRQAEMQPADPLYAKDNIHDQVAPAPATMDM